MVQQKGQVNIPAYPERTYQRMKSWTNRGDFLGTGVIAPQLRKYRNFNQARAFARKLKLKSGKEWFDYTKGQNKKKPKLPDDIPASLDRVYKGKGWKNWPDWLGKKG